MHVKGFGRTPVLRQAASMHVPGVPPSTTHCIRFSNCLSIKRFSLPLPSWLFGCLEVCGMAHVHSHGTMHACTPVW